MALRIAVSERGLAPWHFLRRSGHKITIFSLLGAMVGAVRHPGARSRIAAEHYFHCDALYVVHSDGADALVVDREGHCRDGTNAQWPTSWLTKQVVAASAFTKS